MPLRFNSLEDVVSTPNFKVFMANDTSHTSKVHQLMNNNPTMKKAYEHNIKANMMPVVKLLWTSVKKDFLNAKDRTSVGVVLPESMLFQASE